MSITTARRREKNIRNITDHKAACEIMYKALWRITRLSTGRLETIIQRTDEIAIEALAQVEANCSGTD